MYYFVIFMILFPRFLLLNALLHLPSLFFMAVDICSSKEFWFSLPHRKLSPPSSFLLSPLGPLGQQKDSHVTVLVYSLPPSPGWTQR